MSDISDVRIYTSAAWASTAVLLYDCLITLDEEFELVWKSGWGFPKVLFFVSRYLGLAASLANTLVTTLATSASFCTIFNAVIYVLIVITAGVGDCLLLIRIIAVYHGNKYLRIALFAFCGVIYLVELVLSCLNFLYTNPAPSDGPDLGCLSGTTSPQIGLVATVPILGLNSVFFILTIIKLLPSWRQEPDLRTPVTTLIIRDGSMYFFIICTVLAVSTACPYIFADREDLATIGFLWLVALSPIVSCRMFLNLRKLARPHWREPTVRTADIDRPVFNVPSAESNETEMSDLTTNLGSASQPLSNQAESSTSASQRHASQMAN